MSDPPVPEHSGRRESAADSDRIRSGAKVRVRADCRNPEFRELTGTVIESYGRSESAAFDVRLEDGRSELFWCYELEEA